MSYYSDLISFMKNEIDLAPNSNLDSTSLLNIIHTTSYEGLLSIVDEHDDSVPIDTYDIPQFSDIYAVNAIADIFSKSNKDRINREDLGYFLLRNDYATNKANRKYGENHGKLADQMGLACFTIKKDFSPSVLTIPYAAIVPIEKKLDIHTKLLLRLKIIQSLLKAANFQKVNGYDCMRELAYTTMKRRGQSVRRIFKILYQSQDPSLQKRIKNIYWEE